jgi:CubicO group peptidase (beta-lactamase class C family)
MRKKFVLLLVPVCFSLILNFENAAYAHSVPAAPLVVQTTVTGVVIVTENRLKVLEIEPIIYEEGWQDDHFMCFYKSIDFNPACLLGKDAVDMKATAEILPDGLHIHYAMKPRKTVNVICVRPEITLPYASWLKRPFQLGDNQGLVPDESVKDFIFSQAVSKPLVLGPTQAHGGLSITLTAPGLQTFLQDNRKWTPDLLAYLTHQEPSDKPWQWNGGEEKDFDFTLSFNRPLVSFPAVVNKGSKGFEGLWNGFIRRGNLKPRLALSIEKNSNGIYGLNWSFIGSGVYNLPGQKISVKGRSMHVELPFGGVLDFQLSKDGNELKGKDNWSRKLESFELSRGAGLFVPRMDDQEQPVTNYQYQPPQLLSDGWEAGDLRKGHTNLNLLQTGLNEVLKGSFPYLHGIVVVQHGKLVLDEYFYGYHADATHELASTTKSVLSTLFGIARDQGLLDTKQKLYDFYPEYRKQGGWDSRKDRITLGMLLTMTSGFSGGDWDDPPYASLKELRTTPNGLSFALTKSLNHEPGEQFSYNTTALAPLWFLLEKQSGMPLPAFAQKYLYDPLGITPEWQSGNEGKFLGTHWLKPRDMAKLGTLYLNGGKWQERQILSKQWVEEATSLKVPPEKIFGDWGYGDLWWKGYVLLHGKKVSATIALGTGGEFIFVVPKLDLVCAITAGNYGEDDRFYFTPVVFFEKYVLDALY